MDGWGMGPQTFSLYVYTKSSNRLLNPELLVAFQNVDFSTSIFKNRH